MLLISTECFFYRLFQLHCKYFVIYRVKKQEVSSISLYYDIRIGYSCVEIVVSLLLDDFQLFTLLGLKFVYSRPKEKSRTNTRFSCGQFCIFIQSECIIMHSTYQQPQAPSSLSTPSATRVNKHRRPCEQTIEVDVHKGNHTCSHGWKHL